MSYEFERLIKGRSSTLMSANGLEILIPSAKHPSQIIFILIWLMFWVFAGFAVASSVLGIELGLTWKNNNPPKGIGGFIWLAMWFVSSLAVTYHLVWTLFGYEKIILNQIALTHERLLFGFGRTKRYEIGRVQRLRMGAVPPNRFSAKKRGEYADTASIAFDYGAGTVVMAKRIDPGEGNSIVEKMMQYDKRLRSQHQKPDGPA